MDHIASLDVTMNGTGYTNNEVRSAFRDLGVSERHLVRYRKHGGCRLRVDEVAPVLDSIRDQLKPFACCCGKRFRNMVALRMHTEEQGCQKE